LKKSVASVDGPGAPMEGGGVGVGAGGWPTRASSAGSTATATVCPGTSADRSHPNLIRREDTEK